MALITWTWVASDVLPLIWAEPAVPALAAVSVLAAVLEAATGGQKAITPEAAAAVMTVEPVTASVSFEGFPCRGLRRRRSDNRNPWSGACRALGFHPIGSRCHQLAGGMRRRTRRDAGSRRRAAQGQPSRTLGASAIYIA
jgi:hypothetical protein